MLLFCPNGHEQTTNLPVMGGSCLIYIEGNPELFACKNMDCPDVNKEQHFHPDERSYFLDIDGNRVS